MSRFKQYLLILLAVQWAVICHAKTFFLDIHPGVVNGSDAYDPATRTCGKGNAKVFTELADAVAALEGGDTLYIRAGAYSRTVTEGLVTAHGHTVSYWTGAMNITASGAPECHTVVSGYQGEMPVIQAKPGVSNYNPDPNDTTFTNSSHYYPNPAIKVQGAYVDVIGLKTYGQIVISRRHVTIQGCDLGGGGPHMNQGNVVVVDGYGSGSTMPDGAHDVVIRNNKIHHSCWGEGPLNGSAVMCYWGSFTIENNEFYDNYGGDIRVKDTKNQQGHDVIIRYNFFGPSSLTPVCCGVSGLNQAKDVDRILTHNNIFYRKHSGILWDGVPRVATIAYNNTFVNCGGSGATTSDIAEWQNAPVNLYNNLHYHSELGQRFYDLQTEPWDKLNSDFNLFFSTTGDIQWMHCYRNRGATLTAWQQYSGKDVNSVWKDPMFVNPNGTRPEDFRRKGDPKGGKDVQGSKYGTVCGAYVTGKEIIGLSPKENKRDSWRSE